MFRSTYTINVAVCVDIVTYNASGYTCIIIFLLFAEFRCLLEGQSPSIPHNEDDIMISGEVSVGHTLHPLTQHWHYSAAERGDSNPRYSIGILSAMVHEGFIQINYGTVIPRRNVSVDVALYRVLVLWPFELYIGLGTSVSIHVDTLQYSLL